AFIKAQKPRAYFKRFQDKNKYNTPKYYFVVRFTNKDIISQIISATINGDLVIWSNQLCLLYWFSIGSSCIEKKLEMDAEYEGNVEAIGEDYSVEPGESRRPFRALLDVGLLRTTTGNRIFGALKVTSFLADIMRRKKDLFALDHEIHRKYIFGGHVGTYMRYAKRNIDVDDLEALYKKVHAAIRADPTAKKTEKESPKAHKRYNLKKLTYDERKNKLIERLNAMNSADDDEDEDDE
ncbi:hypothetical protein MKW92_050264, partial [Papaver armeniacum]